MFGSNIESNEWNHFMIILLLDPYFKINDWLYKSILEVSVKISLNLILSPLITPNFGVNKNWALEGIERNECSIHFIISHLNF